MSRRRKKKQSAFSKKTVLGFFIVAIMIFSGIGLMWEGSGSQGGDYNGHKITLYNNYYVVQENGRQYSFNFHPSEVEWIEIENMESLRDAKMFYFVFNPSSEIIQDVEVVRLDVVQLMAQNNIYAVPAISEPSAMYTSYPVGSCFNATQFVPVIMFTEGNETKVTEGGNCFIFQARDRYDVPMLRDRLIYGLIGVI